MTKIICASLGGAMIITSQLGQTTTIIDKTVFFIIGASLIYYGLT